MTQRSQSSPRTFDILSWRDMIAKFERELDRMKRSDDREDLADYSFNFAVTAWHITDWIWADISRQPGGKARLAAAALMPQSRFSLRDFKTFVCGPSGSPAVDLCRTISTSSKHVGVSVVHQLPVLPRVMPAQPREFRVSRGLQESGAPIVFIRARWTAEIQIGSQRLAAVVVFEEVLRFWKSFVQAHGMH